MPRVTATGCGSRQKDNATFFKVGVAVCLAVLVLLDAALSWRGETAFAWGSLSWEYAALFVAWCAVCYFIRGHAFTVDQEATCGRRLRHKLAVSSLACFRLVLHSLIAR